MLLAFSLSCEHTSCADLLVLQVAAGTAHSVVLTDQGRVFTFGWGANGRLGHGDTPFRRNVPTPVKDVENLGKVSHISAGDSHTILVSGSSTHTSCVRTTRTCAHTCSLAYVHVHMYAQSCV